MSLVCIFYDLFVETQQAPLRTIIFAGGPVRFGHLFEGCLVQCFFQFGQDIKEISNNAIVGILENGGLFVFVDGDDAL